MKKELFLAQLTALLNAHSAENGSDTPDFVLAEYLLNCLNAWNEGVRARERWYGRESLAIGGTGAVPRG